MGDLIWYREDEKYTRFDCRETRTFILEKVFGNGLRIRKTNYGRVVVEIIDLIREDTALVLMVDPTCAEVGTLFEAVSAQEV